MRKHVVAGLSVILLAGCGLPTPGSAESASESSSAVTSGATAATAGDSPGQGSAAAPPAASQAPGSGAADPAGSAPSAGAAPAAGAAQPAAGTRRYSNARYRFSVDVPTAMQELGESDNGDGNTFSSGDATLMVFGSNEGGTLASEVAGIEEQGGRVLDRSGSDTDFTITAQVGSDIQRSRHLVGSGSRVVAQWVYPQAQRQQYDDQAAGTLRSLQAQGLDQAH